MTQTEAFELGLLKLVQRDFKKYGKWWVYVGTYTNHYGLIIELH